MMVGRTVYCKRETYMTKRTSHYMAYLLRIWCEEGNDQPVWRASVEVPGPGEQQVFPSFEALVDFLKAQMAEQMPDSSNEGSGTMIGIK
jgi:hypothetical protein